MGSERVADQRSTLRARGRRARSEIGAPERTAATAAIVGLLLTLPEIQTADRVLLTAAVGDELDIIELRSALAARGVTVSLPVVDGDHLVAVDLTDGLGLATGWRGVPEPVGPPSEGAIDVVVLPALALDRHGGRLGYGGGHFDRFLVGRGAGATTVGAVFHAQLVDAVPTLPHDVTLDVVVTERGVWRSDGHLPDGG